MRSLRALAGTIFDPAATFASLVEAPRTILALFLVVLAQLTVPLVLASRLDVRAGVLDEQGPHLAEMTDREVEDAVTQSAKIKMVTLTAQSLVGPPLLSLELTVALWLWGRYLRGKPGFGALYSLTTHAQIPLALRSLATSVVLLGRTRVDPSELKTLLPSGLAPLFHATPPVLRALGGADLFLVWTAGLLGVALWAAAKVPARRAVLGIGIAYAAFVAVVLVALPGLGGA